MHTLRNLVRGGALAALLIALSACGANSGSGATTAPAAEAGGNTVHMNNNRFVTEATTIATGESLTLVADTFAPHVIANGTWANGNTPQPGIEPGAPEVQDLQIQGNSSGTIGPFSEAGSFQFYCPIHPGMNLTVNVE
jgi:plastocyanin